MKRVANVYGSGSESDSMTITPLGAGREVGRSCHLLEYKGKSVLLDCGTHPGMEALESLPFLDYDGLDLSKVSLLLVSHFHLDHAACVPYLTERTDFKGQVWMTHPTKAVMRLLLGEFATGDVAESLYTKDDMVNCLEKCNLLDYHSVKECDGIRFWCYNAGHVLGAAMFMIEIAGVRVLYTGDYSCEKNRYLMSAEIPSFKPEVLIVESTFGIQAHQDKVSREAQFTQLVAKTVRNGGKCLIPIFALGLAQELLLILDEYWALHDNLHKVPIYFSSKTSSKALRVCRTYVNMMNQHIRRRMDVGNPFDLRFIREIRAKEAAQHPATTSPGSCVVLAAPGMLQAGVSRGLFESWCDDEKNRVLIPGYAVSGTMARDIQDRPSQITCESGLVKPLHASVDAVSFAAHVDGPQNMRFIHAVGARYVVLVHGEEKTMDRLKRELEQAFAARHRDTPAERPVVFAPYNAQSTNIPFSRVKTAKLTGALAASGGAEASVRGVMVEKDFQSKICLPSDLSDHAELFSVAIKSTLHARVACGPRLLLDALRDAFEEVRLRALPEAERGPRGHVLELLVDDAVAVLLRPAEGAEGAPPPAEEAKMPQQLFWSGGSDLVLRWDAGAWRDAVADAVAALAIQAQLSVSSMKKAFSPCACLPEDPSDAVRRPGGGWTSRGGSGGSGGGDAIAAAADVQGSAVAAARRVLENACGEVREEEAPEGVEGAVLSCRGLKVVVTTEEGSGAAGAEEQPEAKEMDAFFGGGEWMRGADGAVVLGQRVSTGVLLKFYSDGATADAPAPDAEDDEAALLAAPPAGAEGGGELLSAMLGELMFVAIGAVRAAVPGHAVEAEDLRHVVLGAEGAEGADGA